MAGVPKDRSLYGKSAVLDSRLALTCQRCQRRLFTSFLAVCHDGVRRLVCAYTHTRLMEASRKLTPQTMSLGLHLAGPLLHYERDDKRWRAAAPKPTTVVVLALGPANVISISLEPIGEPVTRKVTRPRRPRLAEDDQPQKQARARTHAALPSILAPLAAWFLCGSFQRANIARAACDAAPERHPIDQHN